jgi:hypothetical protein
MIGPTLGEEMWFKNWRLSVTLGCLALSVFASRAGAQTMNMPGMNMPGLENSVGYLSSGTSIEPKVTSKTAAMLHGYWHDWAVMFHGNVDVLTIQQTGPRGGDKTFSTNWLMPMLARQFDRHTLLFRTMISVEPWTVTQRRYPELLQTGETAYGLPIVDGQHPHNLVMEISGKYDFRIGDRSDIFVYGGPVAEPALGPTAFSHRVSASEDPLATLGHHEQDSTHVSYSVITIGFVDGPLQLEASTFHGREPSENRWTIGTGEPDSFSSRLTVGPTANLTGQVSIGRINHREALEPNVDTLRTTASLTHVLDFRSGHIASSLIWGRNKDLGPASPRIFNSYALESTVNFSAQNWAWTRIENVDRDRTVLIGEVPAALSVEEDPIGRVQAYTFGYERDLPVHIPSVRTGFGAQITTYGMPQQIAAVYGPHPRSFVIFVRFRPNGNMNEPMHMMHGH